MLKKLKVWLTAIMLIVASATTRIINGQANPGPEEFVQSYLRKVALRYVEVTS